MASSSSQNSSGANNTRKKRKLSEENVSFSGGPDLDDSSSSSRSSVSAGRLLREDLQSLGIYYAKEPTSLDSIFDGLKRTTRVKSPKFLHYFDYFLQDLVTFCARMDKVDNPAETKSTRDWYLREHIAELEEEKHRLHNSFMEMQGESKMKEILRQAEVGRLEEQVFMRLFTNLVSCYAPGFLESCKELMEKLGSVIGDSRSDCYFTQVHEGVFTRLIKDFTSMMLLRPSLDTDNHAAIKVKGKSVSSSPDVLFEERNNTGSQADTVLIINEVKRSSCLTPKYDKEETWIGNRIIGEVLGQIGSELLVKRTSSIFSPYVLGILCIRTEISFVLLDLKTEHLEKILDGKDASGEHNEILYTKTFDIMKAEDRAEVNKFLLWLASVQSNKFRGVL